MFTTLPPAINTIDQAKAFLTELYENGEAFNPEDDANDIVFPVHHAQVPDRSECDQLNKLMADIYELPGNNSAHDMVFDPCGFLLDLQAAEQ